MIASTDCRKKYVSPRAVGVAAIANQMSCDTCLSGVTISAKAEWNENKHISSFLDYARRSASCGKSSDRIHQRERNIHKPIPARRDPTSEPTNPGATRVS